jgi:hypothetical protein
MRRSARLLVAGALCARAAPLAASGRAGAVSAVSGIQTGSWWQVQPAGGQLPPPANVPTKGVWVQSTSLGPEAISAIRFVLSGVTAPVLHLRVHQAQPAALVAVIACPAKGPWKPTTAGPWSLRPVADCSGAQASGALSSDGTHLTLDLSGLPITNGGVDVVIEPAMVAASLPIAVPSPLPTPAPTFDATFEPVQAADIVLTPSSPDTGPGNVTPPVPVTVPVPTAAPSGDLLQPPLPLFVPVPPTISAPAIGPAPTPPSVAAVASPAAVGASASKPAGQLSRRLRYLLAMILLDLVLWSLYRGAFDVGPSGGRVTLYDDPALVPASRHHRPTGAPSLR